MDSTLLLVATIVGLALLFDFVNGFHDAANSIATIVSTRVLTPGKSVLWAAFFNFVAAFTFGTGVAKTVGEGMVDLHYVTPYVILAGVLGATVWDLLTWWWGLPASSSHALIGGYAGAAMAQVGRVKGVGHSLDALRSGREWNLTLLFIVVAPAIGLVIASILMIVVYRLFQNVPPAQTDHWFRRLQLVSAALLSWSHGANDAQKTMGVITGVLVSAKYLPSFHVPVWVILSAHAAIALGTLSGGWRIVRTVGSRLTKLKPRSGFCAETAAGLSILFATALQLPVSTTHAAAGAITGVGAIQRVRAVRWNVALNILWAWVLTIPAAALMGWLTLSAIHLVTGR